MAKLAPRFRVILGEVRQVAGFDIIPDMIFFNRLLKKTDLGQESEVVRLQIQELGDRALELITPMAHYGIFQVDSVTKNWFPDAKVVGLALVTIGPGLESEINRLSHARRIADSLVLDAWGSALVEGSVEVINEILITEGKILGFSGSKRRSPGYKPWQMSEQSNVFKYLNSEKLNISLSETHVMTPRKSVSFGISFS